MAMETNKNTSILHQNTNFTNNCHVNELGFYAISEPKPTPKNALLMETNKNTSKIHHFNFSCEICKFYALKKGDFTRHLSSAKHYRLKNTNKNPPKSPHDVLHYCDCGKSYQHVSSLYKHKKTCNPLENKIIETKVVDEPSDKQLIMMLIKENIDFKTLMMEVIKNGTHNTNTNNNTNTTNSHNKTFNLQFFLNETCKNAMNLTDFIDSIHLQLSDLERVGKIGYVEGISEIIVKNLNDLDVTQRPIHCTDKKRETLYVKDENIWEKEDDKNSKIRKGIKRVARKNSSLLKDFREKYPEYKNSQSKVSDKYNTIIVEAMGGKGDNDGEKEDKIIKNISKVVSIEKDSVAIV